MTVAGPPEYDKTVQFVVDDDSATVSLSIIDNVDPNFTQIDLVYLDEVDALEFIRQIKRARRRAKKNGDKF